jgi:hypothetical protein
VSVKDILALAKIADCSACSTGRGFAVPDFSPARGMLALSASTEEESCAGNRADLSRRCSGEVGPAEP